MMHVRQIMIGCFLLLGAAFKGPAVAAAPVHAAATSCSAVAHEIEVNGAKTIVDRLFNSPDNRDWERLLREIERGRPECVRLAKTLRPGTDNATGETLNIALSRTLATNSSEVLALGDSVYPLNAICRDNNIEPTSKEHHDFMRRAKAGLAKVQEPALLGRRDACLRNLSQ